MCLCDTYIRVCVCVSLILLFLIYWNLFWKCICGYLSVCCQSCHWIMVSDGPTIERLSLWGPPCDDYPSCSLLHCCQNLWQHFSWPKAPHLLHSFFHLQCDSCLLSLSVSSSRSDRSGGKVAMATYPSMDCSLLPQTLWNTEKQKHMPRQNKLQ